MKSQQSEIREEFIRAREYAAEYRGTTPISHLFNTRLDKVSELLGVLEAGRVLDVGCGPGLIGERISGGRVEYYGRDISPEMIEECLKHFGSDPNLHFTRGRIESLPFPADHFDVVLCLGALEYLPDPGAALDEIARVLKPRGLFIITMQNGVSPYRLWQRFVYLKSLNILEKLKGLFSKPEDAEETRGAFSKVYGRGELQGLLAQAGLETRDLLYYDFNVFLQPMDLMFGKISVLVSRKLERLARGKLKFIGTGFIFKCVNVK